MHANIEDVLGNPNFDHLATASLLSDSVRMDPDEPEVIMVEQHMIVAVDDERGHFQQQCK